ncbi:ABC transporter ATPase [Nonlabens antarcticus]|uniref:ABC transporter ATPase n=1 Tax=Nonlabens antarcticus TaxID=392714 RepID=UPI001891BD8D|nr:ABC transporter ATPase [Nonlabens antarcticus]
MLVDFKELPEESRVWIYQANRTFTEDEIASLKPQLDSFLKEWTAHGQDLQAGYDLPYNRFIVLGLDQTEANATGCSIDASVHFIQALEKEFNIDLMDKMNVSFKNGPYVAYKDLADFRKMAKAKSVSANTIVFNNLVQTVGEYKEYWEVPASESWHKRFF